MSFKINGTVVIDNSRNVCACCITADSVEATSQMVIPSGTTACRPTGSTGSLYYDTDEGALVAYDGTDWAKQGGSTFDYTWSFGILGGFGSPAQSYLVPDCANTHNGHMSAIYPHIDGGWEAAVSHPVSPRNCATIGCSQVSLLVSRPNDGTKGIVASASIPSGGFQCWYSTNPSGVRQFGGSTQISSPVPFNGLTPKSSSLLYSVAIGHNRCLYYSETCPNTQCHDLGRYLVLGSFQPGSDPLRFRCMYICDCSVACGVTGALLGGRPNRFIGAYNTTANGNNQGYPFGTSIFTTGLHCCGFMFGTISCADCTSCNIGNVRTLAYTLGGFDFDYYLTTDTCAPECCCCMKYRMYCQPSGCPFVVNGHFDYTNKRIVGILQGCNIAGSVVWCLCNTSSPDTRDWELCSVPYRFCGGSTGWANGLVTQCFGAAHPGKTVFWKDCIWGFFANNTDNSKLYAVHLDGVVDSWTLSAAGSCYLANDLFVDCDCNLRIFGTCHSSIGYCSCRLIELVLPCSAAVSPHDTTACCVCVYYWDMLFKSSISCRYRMATPGFYHKSANGQTHKQVFPCNTFTTYVNYDCANNRLALNSFVFYGHTVDFGCCNFPGLSVLVPNLPLDCTSATFFSNSPYLCMSRTKGLCVKPAALSQCIFFGNYCCYTICRTGATLASFTLNKVMDGGIGLCAGFHCFSADGLLIPDGSCCNTCNSQLLSPIVNNCCYGLGQ